MKIFKETFQDKIMKILKDIFQEILKKMMILTKILREIFLDK
jgi:hypothetical protein